ncbi:MAG: LysM peptidoglycan-binding domain-containing protein [Saprospiraceae bacterium]|nr:LysM peptidoglycan-binding domain-containing protein [Saprospiraceae bacterium]
MRYATLLLTLLLSSLPGWAQKQYVLDYIEQYKEIAISEMLRTGIPASIKLAQGILESDAGRSDLALNSNNHFGIKCGPIWTGKTFYKEDDDRDRRGRLIKSCFRVFPSPQESFVAHSEFLLNPNKAYRYGFLFAIERTDYKSWAWGLKESGYATNPRYAVLLISLIERYELYPFDYYEKVPGDMPLAKAQRQRPKSKPRYSEARISPKKITASWKSNGTDHVRVIPGKVTNNGLTLVYAQLGDTPRSLADRHSASLGDIMAFNENIHEPEQLLATAERVYLEEKKKKYKGSTEVHTVLEGETIYEIAQMYGIQLQRLLDRNRMGSHDEPLPGERIHLRKKAKKKARPRTMVRKKMPSQAQETVPVQVVSHTVRKGETLYSIARKYNVTVDSLKEHNELASSLIHPGQILNLDR